MSPDDVNGERRLNYSATPNSCVGDVPEIFVEGERYIRVACRCGTQFWRFAGDEKKRCPACELFAREAMLGRLAPNRDVHGVHTSQYEGTPFRDD